MGSPEDSETECNSSDDSASGVDAPGGIDHSDLPVPESDGDVESLRWNIGSAAGIGDNGDTGATDCLPERRRDRDVACSDLPVTRSCRQMLLAMQRPRRSLREHPDYNLIRDNIFLLCRDSLEDSEFDTIILASNSLACTGFDGDVVRDVLGYVVCFRNAIARTDRSGDIGGTGGPW